MNQWAFVIAAYVVTLIGTGAITWGSYVAMRRAERSAEELRRR